MTSRSIRDRLRADPREGRFQLSGLDPASTPGTKRSRARDRADGLASELYELQEKLFAEHARSLLLVLQGMDTSGKDGTIKHVIGGLNPAGTRIASFKAPTAEEKAHDFLWRIRPRLPEAGQVGIFNRSHYEDVLIVRVHGLVPKPVWQRRYEQIDRFEREVVANGTTMVKVFLHISPDEQRKRLLARLDDPTKRWKFNPADLKERARWDQYVRAYEDAIARCSTREIPWFIVPADRKWYRNWAVTMLLLETLREMDPRYPQPDLDLPGLRAALSH